MSLSFRVVVPSPAELPAFHDLVGKAGIAEPVQLGGAGWTGESWPRGLLARVVDVASAAHPLELTPDLEASYARAGIAGSFVAHVRGSSRGVAIVRTAEALSFHVPVFASAADYALAVGLAVTAARLMKRPLTVEDPVSADGVPATLDADAVAARWSGAAADAHARQVGGWLADDIGQGRTYWFYGPRGFVEIGPRDLESTDPAQRFSRVQELLAGGAAAAADAAPIDARRCAVLLTAAMVFAAGADGVLADEEARQLEAHFSTVRELGGFPPHDLLEAVRAEVAGIATLGELPSALLRRKAFVLAAEVIASARGGKLDGDPSDPNVRAVIALTKALSLVDEQVFVAQVVRTVMAKYEDAGPEANDAIVAGLALAMVMTAAADGHIDEQEAAVLSALARTVPELKSRDVGALFEMAKTRTKDGAEAALRELESLPCCKSKCFALATEVGLVAGKGPVGTLLPRLREALCPDRDDADAAIATFAAKYASPAPF